LENLEILINMLEGIGKFNTKKEKFPYDKKYAMQDERSGYFQFS